MQRTLTDKIKNMLAFAKQSGKTLTGEPADEIDVHPSTSPGVREETLAERNKENQERKREWLINGRDKDHKSSTRAKKNARAALAKEDTEDSSNSLDSYKPSPTNLAIPAPPPQKKLPQNKNNKPSGIPSENNQKPPKPVKPIGEAYAQQIITGHSGHVHSRERENIKQGYITIKRRDHPDGTKTIVMKHKFDISEGYPMPRINYMQHRTKPASPSNSARSPMSPEEKAKWADFENSLPPHMQASAKKNAALKAAEKARDLKAAEKARDLAKAASKTHSEESNPPWDTKPDSKTSYVGPRKTFKDKFGNRISSPEHMARNLAKQGLEKALKDKNK